MTRRTSSFAALSMVVVLGASAAFAADPRTAASAALPEHVLNATWEWIWFGSGAEQFEVDEPAQYTIEFLEDGAVAIQADCNRGRAEYELGADGQITLSPIATTMMLCPDGSLGDRFVNTLDQVRLYFEKDGDFFLEAPLDSGTLRFRRQAAD